MEILLVNASALALPAAQRADAIVYDGAVDLGLWRPPGPDRDFSHVYGDSLSAVLDKERAQLPKGRLELGQALRLHPGKLRCDFVVWLATRAAHGVTEAAPAPTLALIEQAAAAALTLACKHGAVRIAFGALGAGQGAADTSERMAAIVRGAHACKTAAVAAGQALSVEEVLVCAPNAADVAKARRLSPAQAREQLVARQPALPAPAPRRAASATGAKSRSSRKERLDPADVAGARVRAVPYDRGRTYAAGDWFIHPKLGAAQVKLVLGPERMVSALFEDGEERKLIHARQ